MSPGVFARVVEKSKFVSLRKPIVAIAFLVAVSFATVTLGQLSPRDPGVRGGTIDAGQPLDMSKTAGAPSFFTDGLSRFTAVEVVSGQPNNIGLGPRFNTNQCSSCHAQPAVGGTSPSTSAFPHLGPNPETLVYNLAGQNGQNALPSFITPDGPVREARFKFFLSPDGSLSNTPDGGVHDLFVISGRGDAGTCSIRQPDFAHNLALNNVIFRIPTPVFGAGLIENIADETIMANMEQNERAKEALGISGHPNRDGNDGAIARFGWKAQNKSLLIFAGEAYNVEQGVANEVFMNERSAVPGFVFNATPEDRTNTTELTGSASAMSGDVINFALFMRLSAPPQPVTPLTASQSNGQALFHSIGCDLCHSPSLTTAASPFTGMSNATYHPYSDFAVHHMGSNLADGILQGAAGPDEFRTAPLWGIGQRLFFLHDGRTSDLLQAIQAHAGSPFDCVISASSNIFEFEPHVKVFAPTSASTFCGSEADRVIANFNALSGGPTGGKQDILNFLRSL